MEDINAIIDQIVEGSRSYGEIVKSDYWKKYTKYMLHNSDNNSIDYNIYNPNPFGSHGILGELPGLYVEGNLEGIKIENNNIIVLDIVYDNITTSLPDNECRHLYVYHVSENAEYQKHLRMLNIPCGIKVYLYKEEYRHSKYGDFIDEFFAKSIEVKDKLVFPHFICPECGIDYTDYGVPALITESNFTCEFCSNKDHTVKLIESYNIFKDKEYK